MAERRPTMMDPPVESLLDRVDSKFTLVTLAAKRGRQINSYFNQLGEGLGAIVPPQVTSVSRKPLSIALEEISAGKIIYHRLDGSDDETPASVAAAAAASGSPSPVAAAPEPAASPSPSPEVSSGPAASPPPSSGPAASPAPPPSPEAEQ